MKEIQLTRGMLAFVDDADFDWLSTSWRAQIGINNRCVIVGNFATRESAASAYDVAAKELHGSYARTNL